jgi:hypothetical protein
MENIINLIATDSSASDISDSIKSELYSKTLEKINQIRPHVANSMFGIENSEEDNYQEEEE